MRTILSMQGSLIQTAITIVSWVEVLDEHRARVTSLDPFAVASESRSARVIPRYVANLRISDEAG